MTGTDLTLRDFDYAALAADVADEMRARASRIHEIRQASVLEVGRELIAAKEQVEHGCFVAWVQTACQMNIRGAERAMQAAELVEKNDKLSYLPPDGLLALASRSAPPSVVTQILGEIAAGETPNAARIKRRIAQTKMAEKRAGIVRPAEEANPTPAEEENEQVVEDRELQNYEHGQVDQAAVTQQLVEMLLAWDRFDKFMALLKKADISSVAKALKDRHDRLAASTVTEREFVATEREQTPLERTEAVADKPMDDCIEAAAERTPLAMTSESSVIASAGELMAIDAAAEAAPLGAATEEPAGATAEQLAAILATLKPKTQWYGRQWIAEGCPITNHPDEHFVITEKLLPFRAAVRRASERERQRFLEISAQQAA
jgi:Protein of unknown function (DUF3102)